MSALRHFWPEYHALWRLWVPLSLVTMILPFAVLAIPLVEKQLIDDVVLGQHLELLPSTVALYAGLWVFATAGNMIDTALRAYLGEQMTLRIRQRLLRHCERLSLAFSRREHSGRTAALLLSDVPSLSALLSATVFSLTSSLVMLVLAIVVTVSLSWQLAIVVGTVPPAVAIVAWVVTRPLRPVSRKVQEKTAELTERLQESLAGIREITAYGQNHARDRRVVSTMGELVRLRMRMTFIDLSLSSGQMLVSLALTIVVLGYGGYLVVIGDTTLGSVLAVRALFSHIFVQARNVVGSISGAQKALASADRVNAFLDEAPQVQESREARLPRSLVGGLRFERVSFSYQPGHPVLQEISFVAHPGEVIAMVGPSGAGKSTLVSLIPRFYDPTAGQVLIDGIDLRDLRIDDLRGKIGIVFQDTFLFYTTIRENIALSLEGATEAAIIAAARAANAWEFIDRLPDGLDTLVGERGVRLSEGQKQRVAIARALLRDPRILILDEPTSALDARSEHLLQSALDNLMRGRTTLVIAHRLATVQRADRIVVLDSGRIVEQGSHAELLRSHGLYHELYELQFGGAIEQTDSPGAMIVAPAGSVGVH